VATLDPKVPEELAEAPASETLCGGPVTLPMPIPGHEIARDIDNSSLEEESPPTIATFEPSLVDALLSEARITPESEGYEIAMRGVRALLTQLLVSSTGVEVADRVSADMLVAAIDEKVSRQVDAVLHHADFRRLESAWRGLRFTVDRTDFEANCRIELLNVSKEELVADFQDAPEITKSGFYKTVYTAEFGTFGGKPYGAIFADYEFGPGVQDLQLLTDCAAVAAMAHVPFLAAAAPQFFGGTDYSILPGLHDLRAIFEGPKYMRWQMFRDTAGARYVGLLLPRFLLRTPYDPFGQPTQAFNYEENFDSDEDAYCWGNAIYAFATKVADSFVKFGWCLNLVGSQAGGLERDFPTDVIISERREFELSNEGFISLTFQRHDNSACFLSANSVQKPRTFGQSKEAREAELNYRLGTQLPYLFVVCRIAHYLKVLQREQVGTWKTRLDLESELNNWIGEYVADMEAVSPLVRSQRPLRQALIRVEEVPGKAGWYKIDMKVRLHFKYMGASFTLNLVGKLDK
jgi:type VI secretion system protein ImpC